VWAQAASGLPLPGMTRKLNSTQYAMSITNKSSFMYPFQGDPFAVAIVAVGNEGLIQAIEKGYASFDMKPGLLAGPKHKTGKSGNPYTTVPFLSVPYYSGLRL